MTVFNFFALEETFIQSDAEHTQSNTHICRTYFFIYKILFQAQRVAIKLNYFKQYQKFFHSDVLLHSAICQLIQEL